MHKSCSDDKPPQTVSDEADLAYACNGAEREDVLFYLSCEAFPHLHNVSLCLVLIALGQQDHCIWVLE